MGFDALGQTIFKLVHERHLVYASCWEDPAVDRRALQLISNDRVLVITSAGCNALDYLLDEPESVCAVDVNYRQNALLELKRAAIVHLEWEDFFQFFGRGHHPQARELYHSRLRSELQPLHQTFWDRTIGLFNGRKSFYFRTPSGRFAWLFRATLDYCLRAGRDIDELLQAETVPEQQAIYARQLKKKLWGKWLGWLMRRNTALAMSGIPPQQRTQLLKSFPDLQEYLRSRAEHLIDHSLLRENYFWRVYLTGQFTPECCPRYLRVENFARLRELVPRLTTHTASVAGFLQSTTQRFTHYVLLDHMDWLAAESSQALQEEWQGLIDHADERAKFLWRSLGLNTHYVDDVIVSRHGQQRRVGDLLRYDEALSEQLRFDERISAYGCVRVASLTDEH